MIAWGLSLAADRWGDWNHRANAVRLTRTIERLLVREIDGVHYLLPGVDGFEKDEGLIINPSYYIFPALQDLARMSTSPKLAKVAQDGEALIRSAKFGQYQLPADWLLVTREGVTLSPQHKPLFGYEAVRVPLYLAWGNVLSDELKGPYQQFWGGPQSPRPDAWIDLKVVSPR